MYKTDNKTKGLAIKELFKKSNYIIPIYQRNYAWTKEEIVQLLEDINDYSIINPNNPYYIGSLVVYPREENLFEVIDGQQRLTTIFILLNILLHKLKCDFIIENINLNYECRERSLKTLQFISNGTIVDEGEIERNIFDAYDIILKRLKKQDFNIKTFVEYLLNHVSILRTEVPDDTDLNHYFEIMNNRGVQLEKHEVLKSTMMSSLNQEPIDMDVFNLIWDACSNMNNYIQYSFPIYLRDEIFGNNWSKFKVSSFEDIVLKIKRDIKSNDIEKSIRYLVENTEKIQNPNETKKNNDDADLPERFTSVISFPNFLLHVLKIQENIDIPLDDKRLIETFSNHCHNKFSIKKFMFNLLKLRYLFDKYITKREYLVDKDRWSLMQLIKSNSTDNSAYYKNTFQNEGNNKKILMLLTMFHVSYPTQIYKHWLTAVLKFLIDTNQISEQNFIHYLKQLAKNFIQFRYLTDNPLDFHKIIFKDISYKKSILDFRKLNCGTNVENFIFNYLDYLIWESSVLKYKDFEFSFRTSVEHYYPQNPMEGIEKLEDENLNSFGNLCLISHNENSRLRNHTPIAKKDYYLKLKNNSLKQRIMMNEYDVWNKKEIKNHYTQMKNIIDKSLN